MERARGARLQLLRPCRGSRSARLRARTRSRPARARRARTARSAARRPRPAAAFSSVGTRRLTTTGARPSESSSTSRNFGRETSACASTTICCSPPESVRATAFQRVSSCGKSSSAYSMPVLRLLAARARRSRRAGCPRPSGRAAGGGPRGRSRPRPRGSARAAGASAPCRQRGRRPPVGRSTPPTASTSVDLPAPFGPSSVVTSPGGISSEISCRTGLPPRETDSPSIFERWTASRSQLLLRAEVGADHVLVRAAPPRSGPRRSACRSRARRSSRSRRRRGSCRGRRGSRARRTASGIFWITSPRWPVSSSGRPAAGSSSSTSRGPADDGARDLDEPALARAERCRPSSSATPSRPTNSIAASTSSRRDDALRARVLVDHRDVVEDRELLDRLLGLERPPQAPARAPVVGHLQQVLAERA